MGKEKSKKRRRSSCSSSSSSDSDASREKKKLRKLKKKLKKEKKKTERALKKKLKEEKKRLKKKQRSKSTSLSRDDSNAKDGAVSTDIPLELMEKSKAMAPMTKEEWEKRQSVVRKVLDEETGRYRLSYQSYTFTHNNFYYSSVIFQCHIVYTNLLFNFIMNIPSVESYFQVNKR
ncbi:unnamed protein product [Spodoptera exigua]|nr:unnamed protein product [Spodoptera exigua]